MENSSDGKESESRKLLSEFDFEPKKILRTTWQVTKDPYTYNIKLNPFIWLGLVLGLPTPLYILYVEYITPSQFLLISVSDFSSYWFLLGHPLWMGLLFGGLGTFYWNHHANLQHQATHDELTNLLTHSTFHTVGKRRIDEALRYDKILSLVMLDLDHFKTINDTYGHKKGDEVLVKVAKLLRNHSRTSDIVGRYGGEEFAILLPETTLSNAYTMAKRIRENIDEKTNELPEFLTVSGGVGTCPLHGKTLENLIKIVDDCLYLAKENGRNQICTVLDLPDTAQNGRKRISMSDMAGSTSLQ